MRPQATFSFLSFSTTYSFFHSPRRSFLLVALSSSSLLLPRPSFLLVPRFSSSSTILVIQKIRQSPFFIDFDEGITDGPTDGPTNQPTDG